MSEKHSDNVYAFDRNRETVYVLNVPKGKNGYKCCGCEREVIAIHRTKDTWQPYFRHHVSDANLVGKCTYRDETYRHKLAKEILQRIKKIRVPGVKKNPPSGMDGDPMIISRPRTISARTVLIERQFYEGEDNQLHSGSNPDIKVREHIIKPDVTFFDEENDPILFIEIEATHAVDQAKYLKIKRLGIDTVQVKIPKDSPEEIEKCFSVVKHTKWIFNNEFDSTPYVPTSGSHNPGISESDEIQEGIYEETLSCRRAQIGNLIRSINRCLESEHYSRDEESARRKLEDASKTTEGLRKGYEKVREGAEARAFEPFEQELKNVEERREGIRNKETELEERYRAKRAEIDEDIETTGSKYESRIEELGGKGRSFEERKKELRREAEYSERILREISDDIRGIGQEIKKASGKLKSDFKSLGENFREKIADLEKNEEAIRKRLIEEKEQIEVEQSSIGQRYRKINEETRTRIRERTEQFAQAVRDRNAEGDGPGIAELRRVLRKYQQHQGIIDLRESIGRVKNAKEWFETAPWKSWG